jgi:hypothetical protein
MDRGFTVHVNVIVICHQNPEVLNYSEKSGSCVFLKGPFKANVKSGEGKFRHLVKLNAEN